MVAAKGFTTEVLGTQFNINSYEDEQKSRATLLEGKIKVNQQQQSVILQPKEQAVLTNGKLEVKKPVDINNVMAWKNGIFNFSNERLDEVLREISRMV